MQNLRKGNLSLEPISYSELTNQLQSYELKCEELESELSCLKKERAWTFSVQKKTTLLEGEIQTEFKTTIRDLKSKENHLNKTLCSWLASKENLPKVQKRKGSKAQASFF